MLSSPWPSPTGKSKPGPKAVTCNNINKVGLGRLTPLPTDPPTFSPEEAWRGERECDRRRKAFEEIIRLGEGLE